MCTTWVEITKGAFYRYLKMGGIHSWAYGHFRIRNYHLIEEMAARTHAQAAIDAVVAQGANN